MRTVAELKKLGLDLDLVESMKDNVAIWWDEEKSRHDAKSMIEFFMNRFGMKKEQAVESEFFSREDSDKLVERILECIIDEYSSKLHAGAIASSRLKLSKVVGAYAEVEFRGETYKHNVDGHIAIVGEVHYSDGSNQTLFQRFISHPFWQYSHKTQTI